MVNYKGPPKRFTMEESEELRTKAHAYSTDLQTGEVIIEEIPGYELAGKKDIIVNNKKVAEIADMNKDVQPPMIVSKTKQEQELEQSRKYWEQYYKDNQGKISGEFPKNVFSEFNDRYLKDKDKKNVDETVQELAKLLDDY